MTKNERKLKKNLNDKRQAGKFAKMSKSSSVVYMLTEKYNRTIKVGFAEDFEKRMAQYRTYSTSFVVLDVRQGTKEDEKRYQKALEEKGFKRFYPELKSEWFVIPEEIKKDEIKGFKFFDWSLFSFGGSPNSGTSARKLYHKYPRNVKRKNTENHTLYRNSQNKMKTLSCAWKFSCAIL